MTFQVFHYAIVSLVPMLPGASILKRVSVVLHCISINICLVGNSFPKEDRCILEKVKKVDSENGKLGNMVDCIIIQKIFLALPWERTELSYT